jgi:hypothetical protein
MIGLSCFLCDWFYNLSHRHSCCDVRGFSFLRDPMQDMVPLGSNKQHIFGRYVLEGVGPKHFGCVECVPGIEVSEWENIVKTVFYST